MKQILGDKLHHLRKYVETSDSIDPEQRAIITESLDEIQKVVPQEEPGDALHHPLRALKNAVGDIETNHPQAVAAFQQICDTLARMGI